MRIDIVLWYVCFVCMRIRLIVCVVFNAVSKVCLFFDGDHIH